MRVLLAIATIRIWSLHELDVNNAFIHGFLEEEVHMKPHEGYIVEKKGQVCKLRRTLYGLKQASRQWNIELCKFLEALGFAQSLEDYSLSFSRR